MQEVKDPAEESRYITEQIKKIMKDGIEAEEIAVLYRCLLYTSDSDLCTLP